MGVFSGASANEESGSRLQARGVGSRLVLRRLLIGLSLFLVALAFYFYNLRYLAPCFFATNTGPFLSGDTVDTAQVMKAITFSGDMQKHLLFSLVTAPLVSITRRLLDVDENTAIVYALATISATTVTVAWLVLVRHVTTVWYALLFAVIFGVAFSNVVLFSVPETYAITELVIIGYFWLVMSRAPASSMRDAYLHGFAAGLAGLFNPPLLSLLIVSILYGIQRRTIRRHVAFAGAALAAAFVVFALPYAIIHGSSIIHYGLEYTRGHASLHNLVEIDKIVFVYVSFFIVSFLSPLRISIEQYSLVNFDKYVTEPQLLLTITLYATLMIIAIKAAIRSTDSLFLPTFVWIFVMVTFYTFFAPHDGPLYASQILFPLILLMAQGINSVRVPYQLGHVIVAAFAVSLALQNISALYQTASFVATNPKVCKTGIHINGENLGQYAPEFQ
jgi:hypothetical protein